MKVPVVIFVYNRLDHTMKTIESLSVNYNANKTDLFIFSDGPKNLEMAKSVTKVREYIDTLTKSNNFKSIRIVKSDKNKGLAQSIIEGVTQIINQYGKVIVLEDDLIVSKDFINYMNNALEFFENENDIWSISGYNIPIQIPEDYSSDVYFAYRGCSWGWGTWKNKWDMNDWDVSDYEKFRNNKKARTKLNRGGRDMAFMLDDQMHGRIDSWAIRWCYTQSKLNKYTVYPLVSRINNIGMDGSGTHSGNSTHYKSQINDNNNACVFSNADLNAIIIDRFSKHYMTDKQYIAEKFKRAINKALKRKDIKKERVTLSRDSHGNKRG